MKDKSMNKFGGEFWDERYSSIGFVYGTEPNIFFKDELDKLQTGNILLLGEGEGRNAVYAAVKGWNVDAVDFSTIGKEKALNFAKEKKVRLNYLISNLDDYTFYKDHYDAVGFIFLHMPPKLRRKIHRKVINTLKPGGKVILEVFDKEQLGKNSGGPQSEEMLYCKSEIENDFKDLKHHLLEKVKEEYEEGDHHKGIAYVLRFVGEKDY